MTIAHARTTDPAHPQGLTDEQIEAEWHRRQYGPCTPQNIRSRRADLLEKRVPDGTVVQEAKVKASGETRPNRLGNRCRVWVKADAEGAG